MERTLANVENKIEPRARIKIAFLTGITGQTGSYLSEFLLSKQYKVYGLIRRSSTFNTSRIEPILDQLTLFYGDLTDSSSIITAFNTITRENPNLPTLEIYNLGAQSHVKVSFDLPNLTAQTTAIGTLNLLEAIRICNLTDKVRFYQAGSSEMFGKVAEIPQTEATKFLPRSPYAIAKVFSHYFVVNYREAYGMFACNGLLFNHESPRRSFNFVTRKITLGIAKIIHAWNRDQDIPLLILGNLESRRDWSDARDMVRGIWLMLQQDTPDDYVLSSEVTRSVRQFVEICFQKRGIDIRWEGMGEQETGYCVRKNQKTVLIKIDKRYFRPSEVDYLLGDSSKARTKLGWKPEISFDQMVTDMLDSDCPERLIPLI